MKHWPAWVDKYIGVPFEMHGRTLAGADCWGLAWMIDQERGVSSPSYDAGYSNEYDAREIAMIVYGEIRSRWTEIPEVAAAFGDRVLFRVAGHNAHIGIVLAAPYFLHQWEGSNSEQQRWDSVTWRHRVVGFYRFRADG